MVYTVRRPRRRAAAARNSFEDRARRTRRRPEELPPEPPHHLRQGRTLPTDAQDAGCTAQTRQPATIAELQTLLDRFRRRVQPPTGPHRSLPHRRTPAAAYTARPKAAPAPNPPAETHDRVRHDKVNNRQRSPCAIAGHLHHIGIGRDHAGTPVLAARPRPRHPHHRRHHRRAPPPAHPRHHPQVPTPKREQGEPVGIALSPMS